MLEKQQGCFARKMVKMVGVELFSSRGGNLVETIPSKFPLIFGIQLYKRVPPPQKRATALTENWRAVEAL